MAAHDGRVCGVMLGVGAGFDFFMPVLSKEHHCGCRNSVWSGCFVLGRILRGFFPRYLDTNFSFVYYLFREWLKGKRDRQETLCIWANICMRQREILRGKKGRPPAGCK